MNTEISAALAPANGAAKVVTSPATQPHLRVHTSEPPAETPTDWLVGLRELRAEVQNLQSLLLDVRDGKAALSTYAIYIETNRQETEALFRVILSTVPRSDVNLTHRACVRHIHNQWQILVCSKIVSQPATPLSAVEQVTELAMCDRLCDEMIAEIGRMTIPARLNDLLKEAWNGYLIPFHDLFSDELPRVEDREHLLRLLAATPRVIKGGIVEPGSGLIFPYHENKAQRLAVCIALASAYLAATTLIWWAGTEAGLPRLDGNSLGHPEINWLLVIAGVITHYAVDRTKGNNGVKSIPLGHLTAAIDARAGVIVMKGLLMLVGFFGLFFLSPQPSGHLDYFLVGYSLDSFVGIVAASLDQRAATRGAALAKKMTG